MTVVAFIAALCCVLIAPAIAASRAGWRHGPVDLPVPQGAFNGPRSGQCWSSLPSNLRPCRLRSSSSFSRALAG